jgi:hypothetical protein
MKTRERRSGTAFVRYVARPLAFASIAAILMICVAVFTEMSGYRGRYQTSGTPVPFTEAWTHVPALAGLIFGVTFLVLTIRAIFRH